jgi:hypothetical protein
MGQHACAALLIFSFMLFQLQPRASGKHAAAPTCSVLSMRMTVLVCVDRELLIRVLTELVCVLTVLVCLLQAWLVSALVAGRDSSRAPCLQAASRCRTGAEVVQLLDLQWHYSMWDSHNSNKSSSSSGRQLLRARASRYVASTFLCSCVL